MVKIALFNHKGGVGKTTLTINIADALADMGKKVLIVDADPQCNISAFYLPEDQLDTLLGESRDSDEGKTIWSAVQPVAEGRGPIKSIDAIKVRENVHLVPGDVLLADYEEVLPSAWSESFARRVRGYDVMCAMSRAVDDLAQKVGANVAFYDVGPNVGPLNRAILLDSDYFITPVAADLFSLRALITVGRAVARWVADWGTVCGLASEADKETLLQGNPKYVGYIASGFKVSTGRRKAMPHADWERMIAPRVRHRVADVLRVVSPTLVPAVSANKIGDIKNFHSLAPAAQEYGLAIGKLRGYVNPGHYVQVDEAADQFSIVAKEIAKRVGI